MAVDTALLHDLRSFIRKRVGYMKYYVGSASAQVAITDAILLDTGVVRVSASIVPEQAITIRRVELYNNHGELWSHQDCNITIDNRQTGVLYWFEFTVKEGTTE